MSTLSAAELATRVQRATGQREATTQLMRDTLTDWERRGIAHQPIPGRWQLTEKGHAMFAGYISAFYRLEDAA